MAQFNTKLEVFTALRTALGVATESTTKGLRQNSSPASSGELKKIKTAVERFTANLTTKVNTTTDNEIKASLTKVKGRIELYWERLFADPFVVKVNDIEKTFFVHRTNNIMEQHFHALSYSYRRIHGNRSIRRNLEHIPDVLPLVANLKNPDYMKLVFDDIENMAKRFSKVDVHKIRRMIDIFKKTKKKNVSQKINKTLRKPDFKKQLKHAFKCVAT